MTAKEKAEQLVDKFRSNIISFLSDNMKDQNAKQCALIAVEEIISEICATSDKYFIIHRLAYYKEVKQEIENYN